MSRIDAKRWHCLAWQGSFLLLSYGSFLLHMWDVRTRTWFLWSMEQRWGGKPVLMVAKLNIRTWVSHEWVLLPPQHQSDYLHTLCETNKEVIPAISFWSFTFYVWLKLDQADTITQYRDSQTIATIQKLEEFTAQTAEPYLQGLSP